MASVSRVKRYQELRESIKDEAGIRRDTAIEKQIDEEDTFLTFVNQKAEVEKEPTFEDTITEAKTFEQLSKESNEEIEKALRSAKSNVGKEEHYDTRMDILNKIRNPEKEVIKIDKMENLNTEQFAKGYLVKEPVTEEVEPEPEEVFKEDKKNLTLMERLASISPKEDAAKAEKVLSREEKIVKRRDPIIEEVRQAEVRRPEIKEKTIEAPVEKEHKVVKILNYAIIALVVVFVVICAMLVYQIFF